MKTVVIGTSAGRSMDDVMAVYPRHKVLVDEFIDRGEVVGIGPFVGGGNLAIFRSRAAAEEFSRTDPFVLEGMVASYEVKDWTDDLLV
jgi:uncharacterized protein YciI